MLDEESGKILDRMYAAMMARRTDVSSSNDRYANLETNFLLQRIKRTKGGRR